jgi:hypothetical protein
MVDGEKNRWSRPTQRRVRSAKAQISNVFNIETTMLKTELMPRRQRRDGRFSYHPERQELGGQQPGKLIAIRRSSRRSGKPYRQGRDLPGTSGNARDEKERYGSGDYPKPEQGQLLPVENTDLVWHVRPHACL